MAPRRFFLAWAAATLLGAALMALPDDNRRVLSISRDHGPAALDFIGMLVVLGGTGCYLVGLYLARRALTARDLALAIGVYLLGMTLTAWSVLQDAGWWWALGLAVALGAHGWLAQRVGGWRA